MYIFLAGHSSFNPLHVEPGYLLWSGVMLVRPDTHIAWRGAALPAPQLLGALAGRREASG